MCFGYLLIIVLFLEGKTKRLDQCDWDQAKLGQQELAINEFEYDYEYDEELEDF